MIDSENIERVKELFVRQLIDKINPKNDQERRVIEDKYYKEVGRIMSTATIKRYVPLFAYKNLRSQYGLTENDNGKDLSGKL